MADATKLIPVEDVDNHPNIPFKTGTIRTWHAQKNIRVS